MESGLLTNVRSGLVYIVIESMVIGQFVWSLEVNEDKSSFWIDVYDWPMVLGIDTVKELGIV